MPLYIDHSSYIHMACHFSWMAWTVLDAAKRWNGRSVPQAQILGFLHFMHFNIREISGEMDEGATSNMWERPGGRRHHGSKSARPAGRARKRRPLSEGEWALLQDAFIEYESLEERISRAASGVSGRIPGTILQKILLPLVEPSARILALMPIRDGDTEHLKQWVKDFGNS